jgi:hypothetical protein
MPICGCCTRRCCSCSGRDLRRIEAALPVRPGSAQRSEPVAARAGIRQVSAQEGPDVR